MLNSHLGKPVMYKQCTHKLNFFSNFRQKCKTQAGVQNQGGRALVNLMQSLICLLSVQSVEYLKGMQTSQQTSHVACLKGSLEFLFTHPDTDNQKEDLISQILQGRSSISTSLFPYIDCTQLISRMYYKW